MGVWMAYAVAVGVLLVGAARVAELALRGRGLPTRHAWTAAMALSLALPALALLPSRSAPVGGAALASLPVRFVATGGPAFAARLAWAQPLLLGAWLVASVLLAVAVFGGLARLARRARRWPVARVGDGEVIVSDDFGPALLGVRAPRVVLPRWTLALDADRLRLVLVHEEEHRRARDGHLLLAGTLAVVLAPWSPALWWQLRRLRAAVELDCDARVLRRGASPRAYGRLLLELGSRSPGLPFPVAALSTSRSLLERRLRMIVRGRTEGSAVRTALAAAAAVALTVAACEAPAPTGLRPTGGDPDAPAAQVSPAGSVHALVADATGAAPWVFVDGQRAPEGVPPGLDPEDIERVEVVKGAAAARLFGPEASDGVIQIFTKAGTERARSRGVVADTVRAGVLLRRTPAPGALPTGLPIYVDGTLFEGAPSTLDPDAIATIDVVGDGAGGGIVRITTKKAARGGGED